MLVENELLLEFHNLCRCARERFWVVSPFLGSWDKIEEIIGSVLVSNSKLDVKLITDIGNTSGIDKTTLEKFLSVGEVKTLSMLHAKLYIIGDKVLVTSANLSETAFCRRYEIGSIVVFDEKIEAIFNKWLNIAKLVRTEDIKDKNYNYDPDRETNSYKHACKKLWELPQQESKENKIITRQMAEQAYDVAKRVYENEMSRSDGQSRLWGSGWNERSANIYIDNLKKMLKGEKYTQTMSEVSTEIYLDNIYKDFGENYLQNAVNAFRKHVIYYREKTRQSSYSYAENLVHRIQEKYGAK